MASEYNGFFQRVKHFIGRYLRLILGILALILGAVFMFIPFIPLGYVLIFVSVLFLSSYIPPFKRLLNYLKKKDKKHIIEKYDHKMEHLEEKLMDDEGQDKDLQQERR